VRCGGAWPVAVMAAVLNRGRRRLRRRRANWAGKRGEGPVEEEKAGWPDEVGGLG
jgi:hypothetical protein